MSGEEKEGQEPQTAGDNKQPRRKGPKKKAKSKEREQFVILTAAAFSRGELGDALVCEKSEILDTISQMQNSVPDTGFAVFRLGPKVEVETTVKITEKP